MYQLLFTSSKNIDRSHSYRWSKVSACVYLNFYCTRDFQTRFPANHQSLVYLGHPPWVSFLQVVFCEPKLTLGMFSFLDLTSALLLTRLLRFYLSFQFCKWMSFRFASYFFGTFTISGLEYDTLIFLKLAFSFCAYMCMIVSLNH